MCIAASPRPRKLVGRFRRFGKFEVKVRGEGEQRIVRVWSSSSRVDDMSLESLGCLGSLEPSKPSKPSKPTLVSNSKLQLTHPLQLFPVP
jgi:hypothetical protein